MTFAYGAIPVRAPQFEFVLGLFFVNFDCILRIYFCFSHHTVFTIGTLFSTVTKNIGYVWRGHQGEGDKPQTVPGPPPPPGFEIPGSATDSSTEYLMPTSPEVFKAFKF